MDVGFNEVQRLMLRAKALHRHTDWLYHADGVSQLDLALARQAGSRPTRIARRESSLISGTPEQVKARLDALQAEEQLDELIIDTPISDGPARLHSLRLLAQAHYGKEVLNVL